tara:strand:+ start:304 stop:987 length:684 start_codon:yes stop_codon:yes gene_type:complete
MLGLTIASGIMNIGAGIMGASAANKRKREAQRKEAEARKEMERLKNIYSNLDTSNPYLDMENVMEDLTVNQQQAEFERQSFQQSQANIMGELKGAAGSSGVAALAQSLAQQGQLAAQKSAASIGAQEAANQKAKAAEASRIQGMERQGEIYSRNLEREKTATLLGMSQQETAAYMQQAEAADQAKWDAISGTVSNVASMIPGFGSGTQESTTTTTINGVPEGETSGS